MKATAEKLENNTVVLDIEVDADQLSGAMDQAYRKLVKEIPVPGFRKGKTPRMVFENFVGKAALYNEAMEYVIPDAYVAAVDETGVQPVAPPEFDVEQVEEGKEIKFKATVKVKPEVVLGQYKGLSVARAEAKVTDDDIDKELAKLQDRHAQLINLEEGAVENGDTAILDFVGRRDGEEFEGGRGNDYSLEIGSGSFIPGFEDQLIGAQIGVTREVNVTFPDDYQMTELAGEDAVFTVTVKSLKRKELAPLDDEFAKDVSEFDTLEELRNDVLNKLNVTAEDIIQQQIKNEALQIAVENAQVDIPEEMVTSRIEEMVENMERRIMTQGLNMENYLLYTGSNMDELKESFHDDALNGVKISLVLEAIAKAEEIEVSDEELDQEINTMAANYQQDATMLRRILEGKNQVQMVKDGLQQQKALNLIADQAELVIAPVPASEEEEAVKDE